MAEKQRYDFLIVELIAFRQQHIRLFMIGRYNVRVGHKLIAVLFVDMLFGDVALRRDERFALSAVTHVFGAQRGKHHETHHPLSPMLSGRREENTTRPTTAAEAQTAAIMGIFLLCNLSI